VLRLAFGEGLHRASQAMKRLHRAVVGAFQQFSGQALNAKFIPFASSASVSPSV